MSRRVGVNIKVADCEINRQPRARSPINLVIVFSHDYVVCLKQCCPCVPWGIQLFYIKYIIVTAHAIALHSNVAFHVVDELSEAKLNEINETAGYLIHIK